LDPRLRCSGLTRFALCYGSAREVYPPRVPFPPWLDAVVARLRAAHPLLRRFAPNHANAIEYVRSRGDYLVAHVDDRKLSGDVIVRILERPEIHFQPSGGVNIFCEREVAREIRHYPCPFVVPVSGATGCFFSLMLAWENDICTSVLPASGLT
jgi:hypothetical protein